MNNHAWDTASENEPTTPTPRESTRHPWDDIDVSDSDDDARRNNPYDDIDEGCNPTKSRDVATMELLDDLLMLLMMSRISAEMFCVLCFNAHHAGAVGLRK